MWKIKALLDFGEAGERVAIPTGNMRSLRGGCECPVGGFEAWFGPAQCC